MPDPAAIPPAIDEFDPLLSPIEGDLFAQQEPHKGLPPAKEVIAAMPPDGQRLLHNARVGAQRQVTSANAERDAARAEAEAAKARIEELQRQVAPAASRSSPSALAELAGSSPILRRVYAVEEGDPFEGIAADVDEAPLQEALAKFDTEALTDPDRARAALADFGKTLLSLSRSGTRKDIALFGRETAKPFEAQRAQQEQAAQARAVADRQATFRASHPGLDDDTNFGAFLVKLDELYPGGAALTDAQLDAGHAAWAKAHAPDKLLQVIAPAPAATVAPPAPATTPTPRAATASDAFAKLREAAQRNTATASYAGGSLVEEIPKGLTDQQRADWLAAHPAYTARLREQNDNGGVASRYG